MFTVGARRRRRRAAGVAAAVLGSLAVGCIAVPLIQQTWTQASATRLRDGTLAAPDLGAVAELPSGAGAQPADDAPIAVAAGVAARGDGAAVWLTTFDGIAPTETSVMLAGDVLDLALSPDGAVLAVVDATGALSVFDIGSATATVDAATELELDETAGAEVATSGDGSFVAVAASGGELLHLYDRASGEVRELPLRLPLGGMAAGPGSTVFALADDAIVELDAADATIVRAAAAPRGTGSEIALVGGGDSVAIWDERGLLLLEPSSLDTVARYEPADPVVDVADGPTEGTIMVGIGGTSPRIALVDLETGMTLSEIPSDAATSAAIGAAGTPASLFVATPGGTALGSWDASRVPWQTWWASAAALALLAGACLVVALRADGFGARARVAAVPTLDAASLGLGLDEPPPPAPAPTQREHELGVDAWRPAAVSGGIHERMSALSFSVIARAPAERVVSLVSSEAGVSDQDGAVFTVDDIFEGRTVTGSVLRAGVQMATFVVALAAAADGGTLTRFHVDWYRTSPPMIPFVSPDRAESVVYGPLRDFAMRLADELERIR
ncbi:MAG: hypothetical protein ACQEWM_10950 [Actinomycetota bacterium]